MATLLTLGTLLLVLLCAALAFLRMRRLQVQKKERAVLDMFWERRDRIPLLLEIVNPLPADKNKVVDLRESLMKSRSSLEEIEIQEKKLSQLLSSVIDTGRKDDRIKRNALFLSLIKELPASFDRFS